MVVVVVGWGSYPSVPFLFSACWSPWSHMHTYYSVTHKHWRGLSPAMATTTTEESSPAPATVAPQQPNMDTSVEPDSVSKSEPSEAQCDTAAKEDEEEESTEAGSSGQENAGGHSVDPEWLEERFRIDRKKLENMLYGECCQTPGIPWCCSVVVLGLRTGTFLCDFSTQPMLSDWSCLSVCLSVCLDLQLHLSLLWSSAYLSSCELLSLYH